MLEIRTEIAGFTNFHLWFVEGINGFHGLELEVSTFEGVELSIFIVHDEQVGERYVECLPNLMLIEEATDLMNISLLVDIH